MVTTFTAKPSLAAFLDGTPNKLSVKGHRVAAGPGELIGAIAPTTDALPASLAARGKTNVVRAVRAARNEKLAGRQLSDLRPPSERT